MVDQVRDRLICIRMVAGEEKDTPAGTRIRLGSKYGCLKCIECLDDPSTWDQFGYDVGGRPAIEVAGRKVWEIDGVRGIDNNTAKPSLPDHRQRLAPHRNASQG
ncbi:MULTISPECIES: hypothetical protein [Rhizobium]|uniref:hypothetical protein n=1 Tax=Rhizobium TaxID=379 RepID=UPI001FDED554|nr:MULTISPECIES: hypothetical protein [Rhizobium]